MISYKLKAGTALPPSLTRREYQIMQLVSHGYLQKEIAAMLFISRETVKKHLRNVYEKLEVGNSIEALRKSGMFNNSSIEDSSNGHF